MENRPSAVEFEDMYSMFSTPLICCSIGVTTVDATTSALAPGYWPETLMMGGAISGYCAIGSREKETPPRITKMIETTTAKIGRSMKKCEIRIQFTLRNSSSRRRIELTHPSRCLDGRERRGWRAATARLIRASLQDHPALASSPPLGEGGTGSAVSR